MALQRGLRVRGRGSPGSCCSPAPQSPHGGLAWVHSPAWPLRTSGLSGAPMGGGAQRAQSPARDPLAPGFGVPLVNGPESWAPVLRRGQGRTRFQVSFWGFSQSHRKVGDLPALVLKQPNSCCR